MKMWGFKAKWGQKVHPNFAPNITMEFHYHAFCAPEGRMNLRDVLFLWRSPGKRSSKGLDPRISEFRAYRASDAPKGPRRTKNSTRSQLTTRSEFTVAL